MKVNLILRGVFALVACTFFAVAPRAQENIGTTRQELQVGLTDLQDITGCDFKPSSMAVGMEVIACPNRNKAFPQAGVEVGDTIVSINRIPVTDLSSLINEVKGAQGTVAQVIVRDGRTGQFAVLSIAL